MSLVIKELLQIGQTAIEKAGGLDPKIDAELLLCHMLNIDKSMLFMKWAKVLEDELCEKYFKLIDERVSGVPVQHIVGWQDFMGYRFKVNKHVLIPRQDTETLVETAIELVKKYSVKTILDLCCGSGAIAISMAKNCPETKVTASDISKEALLVAKENAKELKVEKKVDFVKGDLLVPFKKRLKTVKFDMVISNPPYIKSEVIPTLQVEVREHEPMLALDGGEDGLDFYRKIISDAPLHLKKNGILILEIGHDQAEEVVALIDSMESYKASKVIKDLAHRDRIVICYT